MKTLDRTKSMSILLVTVFVFTCTFLSDTSLATTTAKKFHKAGRTASTSANTIHNGKGVPSNNVGIDGDFYINTLKLDFYGPKNNGHWPAPVSLKGPAGTNGSDGKPGLSGSDGKSGTVISKSSTTGSPGPQGPIGPRGIQGPQGVAGPQGIQGQVGPVGSTGANGEPGIPGAAGSGGAAGPTGASGAAGPTGATGPQGLTGATGSAGIQGLLGAQGVAGSNGATGATGPSEVQVVPISAWQLSTATSGTGNSSTLFGNLGASKSYEFLLGVNGKLATPQPPTYAIQVGLKLHCSDPNAVLTYSVSSSFGYSNDGNASSYSKESFIVIGSITTTAANSSSTLSITAIDSGPTTSGDAMTLSGSGFIQLVGSII